MKMKEKTVNERPLAEVVDVFPEMVLCLSGDSRGEGTGENMESQNGEW